MKNKKSGNVYLKGLDKAKGDGRRPNRVSAEIRAIITQALARGDVHNAKLSGAFITITDIKTSPDLRNATVFFVPLNGQAQGSLKEALNAEAPYFRTLLAKALNLRTVPRLVFEVDSLHHEAAKMDALLRGL